MIIRNANCSALAVIAVVVCVACSDSRGRPSPDSVAIRPDQIVDFPIL